MILALETSTPRATLALFDPAENRIAWEASFESDRAHNAAIFGPVEEVLGEYRDWLTGIAVGRGPGSYGGVRVAIAVANGLGLVLGIPVKGGSSLEAWDVAADSYIVIGDARRKSGFIAEVRGRELVGEPRLVPIDDLKAELAPFREEGLPVSSADASLCERMENVIPGDPVASRLAEIAAAVPVEEWKKGRALEPHYLRAPYITEPKKRA